MEQKSFIVFFPRTTFLFFFINNINTINKFDHNHNQILHKLLTYKILAYNYEEEINCMEKMSHLKDLQ